MLRTTARLRSSQHSQHSPHEEVVVKVVSSPDESKESKDARKETTSYLDRFRRWHSSGSGDDSDERDLTNKRDDRNIMTHSSPHSAPALSLGSQESSSSANRPSSSSSSSSPHRHHHDHHHHHPHPLELSNAEDVSWNDGVGSSIESSLNYIRSPRGLSLVIISIMIFLVVLFSLSYQHEEEVSHLPLSGFSSKLDNQAEGGSDSNGSRGRVKIMKGLKGSKNKSSSNVSDNDKDDRELVPPIHGLAYLSPPEFLAIRTAHPGESVLVTGGLGFIGSHVVDLLLHRGFKVTILDDESNGHNHNKYAREMVPNDITVVGDLPSIPRQPPQSTQSPQPQQYFTHVIHLAAAISVAESMNDPDKYERINYGGSQKVFDWIREYNSGVASSMDTFSDGNPNEANDNGTGGKAGNINDADGAATLIRKVVAASSAAIYGDPDPKLLPLKESAPYGGLSPYADTKFRMEGLMREFVKVQNEYENISDGAGGKGTKTVFVPPASATALRFFNVYGPRQDPKNPYSGVISLFMEAALEERDITILGDGLMTRDFVYVKDVARAIVMALLQEEEEVKRDNEVQEDGGENSGKVNENHEVNAKEEELNGNGKDEGVGENGRNAQEVGQDGRRATFAVYNVCTGKSITINKLASLIKQRMDAHSKITHLAPREGDIRESSCDPTGALKGMGFASAMSQEGGLEKTADWFRLDRDARRDERDMRDAGDATYMGMYQNMWLRNGHGDGDGHSFGDSGGDTRLGLKGVR